MSHNDRNNNGRMAAISAQRRRLAAIVAERNGPTLHDEMVRAIMTLRASAPEDALLYTQFLDVLPLLT